MSNSNGPNPRRGGDCDGGPEDSPRTPSEALRVEDELDEQRFLQIEAFPGEAGPQFLSRELHFDPLPLGPRVRIQIHEDSEREDVIAALTQILEHYERGKVPGPPETR